jgi:hypothetical protein
VKNAVASGRDRYVSTRGIPPLREAIANYLKRTRRLDVAATVAAAANDSGAVTQNYAVGATLTVSVQTAGTGCTMSPADANVVVQYKIQ